MKKGEGEPSHCPNRGCRSRRWNEGGEGKVEGGGEAEEVKVVEEVVASSSGADRFVRGLSVKAFNELGPEEQKAALGFSKDPSVEEEIEEEHTCPSCDSNLVRMERGPNRGKWACSECNVGFSEGELRRLGR